VRAGAAVIARRCGFPNRRTELCALLAIAALVGIGGVWAWRRKSSWDGRCALAAMIVLAAASSAILLHRNVFGPPWLPWLIVVLAVVSGVGVLWPRPPVAALVLGYLAGLAGATAFSLATAATPVAVGQPVGGFDEVTAGLDVGQPWPRLHTGVDDGDGPAVTAAVLPCFRQVERQLVWARGTGICTWQHAGGDTSATLGHRLGRHRQTKGAATGGEPADDVAVDPEFRQACSRDSARTHRSVSLCMPKLT
jgi:hypothetical protein